MLATNKKSSDNVPPFHRFKKHCLGRENWQDIGYACFDTDNCDLCRWFDCDFFNDEDYTQPPLEELEE